MTCSQSVKTVVKNSKKSQMLHDKYEKAAPIICSTCNVTEVRSVINMLDYIRNILKIDYSS